jgi:hypothetical protein
MNCYIECAIKDENKYMSEKAIEWENITNYIAILLIYLSRRVIVKWCKGHNNALMAYNVLKEIQVFP